MVVAALSLDGILVLLDDEEEVVGDVFGEEVVIRQGDPVLISGPRWIVGGLAWEFLEPFGKFLTDVGDQVGWGRSARLANPPCLGLFVCVWANLAAT